MMRSFADFRSRAAAAAALRAASRPLVRRDHHTRIVRSLLLAVGFTVAPLAATANEPPQRFVLLVSGLAGEPFFAEQLERWRTGFVEVARERLRLDDENFVQLTAGEADGSGSARREDVLAALEALAARSRPNDRLLVLLLGHGTEGNSGPRFNLPGPDLRPADLDDALASFDGARVAIVNATASSSAFVAALAAPDRVVVTATSNRAEKHFARFGGHFVDALGGSAGDLDKDGRISLLEAFVQAKRETTREYEDNGLLVTEHAQLEDSGDGVAAREPSADGIDGALAARFYIQPDVGEESADAGVRVRRLELQAAARRLVDAVETLKRDKPKLDVDVYTERLEALLVQLAENRREFRAALTETL